MHVNIAVVLFAVATLLQQSHCIPTHRYVRETAREGEDWTARIKEYLNKIPGYGSVSSESQSPTTSQPETSTYQQGAAAGSASAASEIHSSVATKEGSTSSSGFPSYTDYMPSQFGQFGQYQNNMPNLSQFSEYQNQFGQYFNSKPGSSGAAAGSAGAASTPEASIAAKEGSTSSSGFPSYTGYMPSQYQNNFPSPSQFSQYQNQIPQSMNPGQYFNSKLTSA
ncbi:uncharacterized protein LOC112602171 isoform X2 [Melanaphis sacchari]|uniref:uncharacterized protein LOC112602171 isoform X1 n=1 Tax=Melanaphis sacchari TaxID=742174 RepID=UPI000DC13EBC|nr:uncharacterized protein LOC112602171 isoform X1 [Melanaphis sacchari]XP_025205912.1 uncharacterized protein LOC112602171 isoform X2 [Melanaphis sacchari]